MRANELTTLALRVVAVFVAAQAFAHLADAVLLWNMPVDSRPGPESIVLFLMLELAPCVAAVVIWALAPALGRLADGANSANELKLTDANTLVTAAFVVAGTVLFVVSLPGLISNLVNVLRPGGALAISALVGGALRCLLGVGLALGARRLGSWLLQLRYAGTRS